MMSDEHGNEAITAIRKDMSKAAFDGHNSAERAFKAALAVHLVEAFNKDGVSCEVAKKAIIEFCDKFDKELERGFDAVLSDTNVKLLGSGKYVITSEEDDKR